MEAKPPADLAAVLALALAGCWPVPSVVGRAAGVLPAGRSIESRGGGGCYFGDESPADGESNDGGYGYYHWSWTESVWSGIDTRCGFNNAQAFAVARLGTPAERYGFVPAVSIEAGGSMSFLYADAHLGLNVSAAFGQVAPYFSWRHHWGRHTYRWEPEEEEDGVAEYRTDYFRHHMFFLGVEIRRPAARRPNIAVEVFHGRRPGSDDPDTYDTWGLNVILRSAEW
ncbi:MAG: hypothetical protein ACYSU0_14120 [Planctomycetota bacterium]|jgi:hypothetical protein